jgi:hypothetical protein
MSDQFDSVNEAIRDHLVARYPLIEVTASDGLRLPLGKAGGRRIWIRLGARPGERAFLRATVAVRANEGDALPAWMSSLADAAERAAPRPLRGALEPVGREVPDFDQFQLVAPARSTVDKCWQWGPVVYTYKDAPPSMRAASRCVAAMLDAIRPLVAIHVPGAAGVVEPAQAP